MCDYFNHCVEEIRFRNTSISNKSYAYMLRSKKTYSTNIRNDKILEKINKMATIISTIRIL